MDRRLTRDEARARAALLDVTSYAVDLDLTRGDRTFRSTSTIHFGCREPGTSTFLEIVGEVREATLDGRKLPRPEGNRIALADLSSDNVVRVVADCSYSHSGEGLHRFVDPADDAVYLYSQTFLYDAQRVFACFDQPDLKATYDVSVVAPAGWLCVGNGAVTARPADGAAGRWTLATTARISTYLTAFVAGPYYEVRREHDGLDLGLFCRRSLAPHLDPDEFFEFTAQAFDWYHREFGYRYPFGPKYDQLIVPEFNAGAMENPAAVTFREEMSLFRSRVTEAERERRAEVIAHEMAHMWFGDLVTMRWWDDLWLNESFATYASFLVLTGATRFHDAWTSFCNLEKAWGYRQDQLPSTHPISADVPDTRTALTNFDGISYGKGAAVLKQLAAWVGLDAFLDGLRAYFRRHEFGNTSLRDLLDALEAASGRDLGSWSKDWLETAGVATLRPSFDVDANGCITRFEVVQESATLRDHRLAVGIYEDGVRKHRIELDVTGATTGVPELAGVPRGDLVLLNDDDLTFAKIRFDPASLAWVTERIGQVRDPLARTLCWQATWDMTRDAELGARAYARLVLGGVDREDDIGVMQTVLANATLGLTRYADPARRGDALADFASACLERCVAAPAGSDRQLAFARAFAAAATSGTIVVLRDWLDGHGAPAGLAVDSEVRWLLLARLCASGVAGEEDVARELKRDHTAFGEKHAATARAARPEPSAKEAAWAAVVESDRLSNHLQAATMAGFWQPDHVELCRPYVERYFAALPRVWQTRTGEIATAIARDLYPVLLAEQATLDRTDVFLGEAGPEPALRRVLVEKRADVVRAIRACERDAADP